MVTAPGMARRITLTGLILFLMSCRHITGCYGQLVNATFQISVPDSNPTVAGFPSLYLGDSLTVSAVLQFGSAGDRARISVKIPDEFSKSTSSNLTLTYGSNLDVSGENVQVSATHLNVTFGQVDVVNATLGNSSLENTIQLNCPLYVENFQNVGFLFTTTFSIEYGMNYEDTITDSEVLSYGGPEVDVESFNVHEGTSFIFDREVQTSASFEIPPGLWNMSNTQVILDFTSSDVDFINLDVYECVVLSNSPNITFSNPASQRVATFNDTTSAIAYITIQNATVAPSGRRRRTVNNGQAMASLTWNLFDIANIGDSVETVNFTVRGVIGQTLDMASGVTLSYTFTIGFNGETIPMESKALVVSEPVLVVDKTVVQLNEIVAEDLDYTLKFLRFTVTLSHSTWSTAPAYAVIFKDNVEGLILDYFGDLTPVYGTQGFTVTAQELVYEVDELLLGDTLTISYKAYFNDDTVTNGIDTPLTRVATATWHSMPTDEITTAHPGRSYSPAQDAQTCVTPIETQDQSILYDHGLAALLFFVALIIACIIVAIICLICIKCCRKGPYATVQPSGGEQSSRVKGQGLVMTSQGGATKTGLSNLKEHSMISMDDSIVLVLALKDKMRKVLEFENLDIWWTITIDIQLEQQHIDTMVESSTNLVKKWTTEGAVPKRIGEKCNRKFQRKVKDLNKTMEDEYKTQCRELIVQLSSQNKRKLAELQKKHKAEYNSTLSQTKGMTEEERKEIVMLLRRQHEAEKNEVMQLLKLQQDEQQEKVRKEIAIRKRLAIKSLQESHLDDVILQSKLDEAQAMRILQDHRNNMFHLEAAMDDELSRQRMLLEEKLAKRRALAQSNEAQSDYHKQLLNKMVVQSLGAIDELEKDEKLTEEEAERYDKRLREEFMTAKAEYDKEKSRQEEALHKRLSELKRRKLEERAREHKQQYDQFVKEEHAKLDNNNLDPSQYTEAKLNLLSSQRREMHDLELSLDDEAAKQLDDLHMDLSNKTKEKLKRTKEGLFKELTSHGMTERMKNEILEQHQRDLERLTEEREEQKLKQEKQLKKRLAKHRQEWIKRKQEEKQEQQMIRDHEAKVVGHVLASQLAISEEDRQRILDEHEKQQVALQSSLALHKLKQRRLLEEKLAQRRAKQMEKLQKKQNQETQRDARKRQLADSDEEENDQQEIMKKQAEERIALLSADVTDDVEDELESVRVEMMQARVGALKEQEERLGALVAKLQLERSREIATIEEQQKALWQLKMNMLDNMTETGVIRNAECKKVIETHQKEAKNLENKLKAEREKQEKDFKRRLREKLAEREQTFVSKQEDELQRLVENEKNQTSARLKRVALKHKHLMQMEEFRNNLEVEVNQALEDLRRKFEVERLKQLQEQELQFISGLVKHGKFSSAELLNVLFLLFPAKTKEELEPLLRKMYNKEEGEEIEEDEDAGQVANGNGKRASLKGTKQGQGTGVSLEEKIKLSILGNTSNSAVSTPTKERRKPNKLLKKLKKNKQNNKKLAPITAGNRPVDLNQSFQGGEALPKIKMARPEPVGRTASPVDDSERGRQDTDSDEERRPLRRGSEDGHHHGKSEYSY